MLEVADVHAYRGDSYVLQGVTLRVPAAACTTLLGRNGMGKTTLVRALIGLTKPRSGSIALNGEELSGRPPHVIARKGLALVPQGRHLFPSLNVEENLTLTASKESPDGWSLARVYDLFPPLAERRKHRGNELSGGEQQMVAIGRALLTNPRLLLMDEPSEGLAPIVVARLGEVIHTLREQGLAVLLVEQNFRFGIDLADHVYVMTKGQVAWEGSAAELEGSESIRNLHLGL